MTRRELGFALLGAATAILLVALVSGLPVYWAFVSIALSAVSAAVAMSR